MRDVVKGFQPGLHKLGCTATEDGYRLEIFAKESREIVQLCRESKGADQL